MDQNNEMKDLEVNETVETIDTAAPVEPTVASEPTVTPEPAPAVPVQPTTIEQNVSFETRTINIPEEYKPISMWGYFGYQLLFAIPCIGFIILCVFALGGTKNINLKNFARSYFCFIIIGIILSVIIILIMTLLGVSISSIKIPNSNY